MVRGNSSRKKIYNKKTRKKISKIVNYKKNKKIIM